MVGWGGRVGEWGYGGGKLLKRCEHAVLYKIVGGFTAGCAA